MRDRLSIFALMRRYPAKLLLFGEYTVLQGSQALAIPAHTWSGRWIQSNIPAPQFPSEFIGWLKTEKIFDDHQIERIQRDAKEGWTYQADIPMGFGVGSSGAWVAALFDRYGLPEQKTTTEAIAHTMARMETWYHGASSGMDPLVSYSDHAVWKDSHGQFRCLENPGWPSGWRVWLYNSQQTRSTAPLVAKFREKMQDSTFRQMVKTQLVPMVDHALHFYLQSSPVMLEECLRVISRAQRFYFDDMIPDGVRQLWDRDQSAKGVYWKLCGAGGGGFYLIISTQHSVPDPNGLIELLTNPAR